MTIDRIARAVAFGLAVACLPAAAGATPGLTETVVSDPASGIALYGYDPVAYFTEGRPVAGRRDVEAEWNGAAWRFASAANRAAFLSRPDIYAPRFGGYDPQAVAAGVPAAGHPLLFAVRGARLYLFNTRETRDAFSDPRIADAAWPKVAISMAN